MVVVEVGTAATALATGRSIAVAAACATIAAATAATAAAAAAAATAAADVATATFGAPLLLLQTPQKPWKLSLPPLRVVAQTNCTNRRP